MINTSLNVREASWREQLSGSVQALTVLGRRHNFSILFFSFHFILFSIFLLVHSEHTHVVYTFQQTNRKPLHLRRQFATNLTLHCIYSFRGFISRFFTTSLRLLWAMFFVDSSKRSLFSHFFGFFMSQFGFACF